MMETEDTYWTPLKMDEPVVVDYISTGENCYLQTENDTLLCYLADEEILELFE